MKKSLPITEPTVAFSLTKKVSAEPPPIRKQRLSIKEVERDYCIEKELESVE